MRVTQLREERTIRALFWLIAAFCLLVTSVYAGDLPEIRQRGVLRHLGIPYAHFVRNTTKGLDGLDVELMQLFAAHLGVEYQWVQTSWSEVFGDLTGQKVQRGHYCQRVDHTGLAHAGGPILKSHFSDRSMVDRAGGLAHQTH
jgi:hypothetical protein